MNINRALIGLAAALLVLALPSCKKPNHPPDAPAVPAGPDSGAVNDSLTFNTSALDPDGDSIAVRFDWGDGDTSDWSGFVASGETVAASHAWDSAGTYSISAQARDVSDVMSDWSMAKAVRIGPANQAPDAPWHLNGPFPAHRFVRYEFQAYARDPDDDSVSIRFDWGDGDTSDWSPPVGIGWSAEMSHAWDDVDMFYIRAQARDPHGAVSGWSDSLDLRIPLQDTLAKWCFQAGGEYYGTPAVGQDGTVYVTYPETGETLYAVNPDGTSRWRYGADRQAAGDPAIGPDGTIYFGTFEGYLHAVRPDGTSKWRYHAGPSLGPTSPSIAADGTIYLLEGGSLHAVSADGTLKWRYRTAGGFHNWAQICPAVGADGTVYFGTEEDSFLGAGEDGYLYAVAPDGVLRWRYAVEFGVVTSAAIAGDGTVCFVDDHGRIHALNPDGSLKWRCQVDGWETSSPIIGPDGAVYLVAEYKVYAINPDSTLRWVYAMERDADHAAPALAADGTLLVGAEDKELFAFGPDGVLRWSYVTDDEIFAGPSIAADGTIYIGSEHGFWALRGTAPLADAPWPKFHHDLGNTGRVGGR